MALSTVKGRGSTLRFQVMTDLTKDVNGNYKKPANFATAALVLPEVNTSDVSISTAEESIDKPKMYGSPAPGTGEDWADADPGVTSATLSLSGNVQPVEAERQAMEALRQAQTEAKIIWLERQMIGEIVWEGGAVFITSGSLPIPADAVVTFSFSAKVKGKFWLDTAAAPTAV